MNRSSMTGCVGALAVIIASVALAAEPQASPHSGGASHAPPAHTTTGVDPFDTRSSVVDPLLLPDVSMESALQAQGIPAPFTHIDADQAKVLFSAERAPEAEAPGMQRGSAIPCVDLTISFAEDPSSGLSATVRIRGRDLDGNGMLEADAGSYGLFLGVDEVEYCTLTLYVHGVVDAVQTPVIDSAFHNASFFVFQWVIGSPAVENLDSGSDAGPYVLAGGVVPAPNNTYFGQTSVGFGNFPGYALASGPCACEDPICDVDAIAREGEINNGFFGNLPYDTTNGGCFSASIGAGLLTTPIALGDKLCGQSATTFLGRDTDWYAFSLSDRRTVTVRARSAFDMDLYIFAAAPDMCFGGFDYVFLGRAPRCAESQFTYELFPGSYIIFCAPSGNATVNPGSEYQLELIDSTVCGHPIYDSDAVAREVEPDCDPLSDTVNGGCNDLGFPTTPIALGEKLRGTVLAISTTGSSTRDTDWYSFTLTQPTMVTYGGAAEFPLLLLLLRAGKPTFCDNPRTMGHFLGASCVDQSITMPLPPGAYVAFVAAQVTANARCGSQYQIKLTGTPIHCAGDINLSGATTVADFNILATHFGQGPDKAWTDGDLTGDGIINVSDFNILATNFGCH